MYVVIFYAGREEKAEALDIQERLAKILDCQVAIEAD